MRQIIRRCGRTNWTIDAVRQHLETGLVGLFVCADGFVVLEKKNEDVSGRPYLNVWLAWFKPGKARAMRAQFIEWLDKIALSIGCEWWEFASPRKGWAGIEPDCRLHMQIWRRYL